MYYRVDFCYLLTFVLSLDRRVQRAVVIDSPDSFVVGIAYGIHGVNRWEETTADPHLRKEAPSYAVGAAPFCALLTLASFSGVASNFQ